MLLTTCVFDAYGTLFDVNAAARTAANEPNQETFKEVWPSVSNLWRMKQLQYTWLRSMTSSYIDFWTVTQDSLDYCSRSPRSARKLRFKRQTSCPLLGATTVPGSFAGSKKIENKGY